MPPQMMMAPPPGFPPQFGLPQSFSNGNAGMNYQGRGGGGRGGRGGRGFNGRGRGGGVGRGGRSGVDGRGGGGRSGGDGRGGGGRGGFNNHNNNQHNQHNNNNFGQKKPCFDFQNKGNCSRGAQCRFSHDGSSGQQNNSFQNNNNPHRNNNTQHQSKRAKLDGRAQSFYKPSMLEDPWAVLSR